MGERIWFHLLFPILRASILLFLYQGVKPHIVSFVNRDRPFVCHEHTYATEIVSLDPLVIYISGFLRDEEIDHLLELGSRNYKQSAVVKGGERESVDQGDIVTDVRSSSSAFLPDIDLVVTCVRQRAAAFQGLLLSPKNSVPEEERFEGLQLVRYTQSQKFRLHHDWFPSPRPIYEDNWGDDRETEIYYNRHTSFFLYLQADCTGGGTYFPRLPEPPLGFNWTRYALANKDGIVVNPIVGNGIFWVNLHHNGTGDTRTLHAGLPANGTKVGMNIWTMQRQDKAGHPL